MKQARTRFLHHPPPADLHIGGIRTAIFSWLLARSTAGAFYVRLEDTDQERYVSGSAARIMQSFDWLGIELDGGPDHEELATMKTNEDYAGALADGEFKGVPGPFVQSHRLPIYKQWAEWLVEHGFAYRANETPEELQRMREAAQAQKQTFIFREEMRIRTDIKPDEPHVIRMRVQPRNGRVEFDDLVKGHVGFENANVDDQVLLKMDGFPTYHLAVVVDDHLQGVTHVLRGDDWLPSALKHVLLYQYFGWEQPAWAHVPNVLGTDGKKLSKRHGAQSVFEFRDQGYIPEALINFLALLGWAPGGGDEQNVFTREELFAKFSMAGVGSSPAVFDYNKLDWLNGVHLRKLDVRDLAGRLIPFLEKDGIAIDNDEKREMLVKIVPHISERIKNLTEAAPLVDFFFADIATPPADMLIGPKMEKHLSLHALRTSIARIETMAPFDDATLEKSLRDLCDELQLKPNQLFSIIRNAVTGKGVTPPLFATLAILGRETVLERLKRAEQQLQVG